MATSAVRMRVHKKTVPLHRETSDYCKRVVGNGGSIKARHVRSLDRFVRIAWATGVRNSLRFCAPMAGNNLAAACVPLLRPGTGVPAAMTPFNLTASSYTEGGGMTGNGSTSYLSTSYVPSAQGHAISNGFIGLYITAAGSDTTGPLDVGAFNSVSNTFGLSGRHVSVGGATLFDCYDTTTGRVTNTQASPVGLTTASRYATNLSSIARNGTELATSTNTISNTPPTIEMFICGRNDGGSLNVASNRTISLVAVSPTPIPLVSLPGFNRNVVDLQRSLGRA